MKISEKQLLLLLKVLEGTLRVGGLDLYFGLNKEQRVELYTEILNQQSETLQELETEDKDETADK